MDWPPCIQFLYTTSRACALNIQAIPIYNLMSCNINFRIAAFSMCWYNFVRDCWAFAKRLIYKMAADTADEQWRDGSKHSFVPEAVESYGRSSYSEEYKVKGGKVERVSSKGGRFVAENVRRALKVLAGSERALCSANGCCIHVWNPSLIVWCTYVKLHSLHCSKLGCC